ncbi:MAG: hotdog fold domain-containing protein [Enhygromyxa sp.]
MSIANKLVEGNKNLIREAWDRLGPLPLGDRVFSRMIGLMAPYTGSVGARVVELRPGYSRVVLRDRWAVRNHLTSVHAIALANLAELTGNIALAYSLPDDARFIVAGFDIEYIAKARGTITAICEQELPQTNERCEYPVVVEMFDQNDTLVARATLRSLVGPKKRADRH